MDEIESLCRLCEAVETAGADIAPTYAEYVQLAFAIATDCGEAGREFFHRLCRVSAKYEREHAERIFSNALTTRHGDVHLGTAFHLAERAGVTLCKEEMMNHRKNAKNAGNAPSKNLTHTHVYNKVDNEEPDESEELQDGSDPNQPLPSFTEADENPVAHHELCHQPHTTRCHAARSIDRHRCQHGAICEMSIRRQTPVSLPAKFYCSPFRLG